MELRTQCVQLSKNLSMLKGNIGTLLHGQAGSTVVAVERKAHGEDVLLPTVACAFLFGGNYGQQFVPQ